MASRPPRAAALLLIPLLLIISITSIGRTTSIFAAFDFLGAGAGRASSRSRSDAVPPSVEEHRTSSLRQKNERGGEKHANSSKTVLVKKKKENDAVHLSPAVSKDAKDKSEPILLSASEKAKRVSPTKTESLAKATGKPKSSAPDKAKRVSPTKTKSSANAIGKTKSSRPKLAWLMSFPNSGTSYTSKLIRTITNASTGTNYGASTRDAYGCSRPIAAELESSGPFWQSNTYGHLGGSNGNDGSEGEYLLTKTHCGGYCNGCGPSQYFETAQSFAEACSGGKKSTRCKRRGSKARADHKDGKRFEVVQYDGSAMVKRAVHLLRNPFDNVVSRFHLKAKELDSRRGDEDNGDSKSLLLHFDYNKEGFRKWCKHIDASFVEEESTLTAFTKRQELLKKIPCHADFIRFLLWHHYAERTQANLMLPTLILHYEDYFSNFNQTVAELMAFLNIEHTRNEPELFESGKTYRDYFTTSEKKAVKDLARHISTNETWGRIERYFSSY